MKKETWYEIALVLTPICALIGLLFSLIMFNHFNIVDGPLITLGFVSMGGCAMMPLLIYSYKFPDVIV